MSLFKQVFTCGERGTADALMKTRDRCKETRDMREKSRPEKNSSEFPPRALVRVQIVRQRLSPLPMMNSPSLPLYINSTSHDSVMIPRNASAIAASAASATLSLRQAAVSSARAAARAAPSSPAASCSRPLSTSARWSAELSSSLRRPVGISRAQNARLTQRRGYASSSEGGSEKAKDRAAIGVSVSMRCSQA